LKKIFLPENNEMAKLTRPWSETQWKCAIDTNARQFNVIGKAKTDFCPMKNQIRRSAFYISTPLHYFGKRLH